MVAGAVAIGPRLVLGEAREHEQLLRTFFSGSMMYGSVKSAPSAAGVQSAMCMPFGTNTNARRWAGPWSMDCASAESGTIASRRGSAIAVPTPRRNRRRGIGWLITLRSIPSPHAERFTHYYLGHESREPVTFSGDALRNSIPLQLSYGSSPRPRA